MYCLYLHYITAQWQGMSTDHCHSDETEETRHVLGGKRGTRGWERLGKFLSFPQYNGPYSHTDIAQFLDKAVLSVKTNLLGRDGSFGFNEKHGML